MWERAHYDALTGLPNRALLLDHLHQALRQAERQNTRLAIALIDLDRFKEANDSLGHAAGDELLKDVAERLRRSVRQSDIVARFAGDEFVAVFPGVADAEQMQSVLDKILASLQPPSELDGASWQISASIGVAFYPRDGADAQALLRAADAAMYAVKRAQRKVYPGAA
ncbi:MAG: diguanylate cyclase domain-containing protein [Thiobacillus sp.]